MKIGLGLPTSMAGVPAGTVLEWARFGEERAFASLAVIDRLVSPGYEPFTALAAAAAVTRRIGLMSAVIVAPLRGAAMLAKQALSLDALSGGRFTLGLGVGSRRDDYEAAGSGFETRGRTLRDQLSLMRDVWAGKPLGALGAIGPAPTVPGGPPLLLGGRTPPAFARAARFADGWISGGGGATGFTAGAQMMREQWRAAGRAGQPRLMALAYYALGENGSEAVRRYLENYYQNSPILPGLLADTSTTPERVRDTTHDFMRAGCDELLWFCCSPDPRQAQWLHESLGGLLREGAA
jgi:alkanesulfonate monooxygenase SsuD/methylene tetrahydromethanopterin reductase-like flavin-dependent oxidoreductase (luciferase family)